MVEQDRSLENIIEEDARKASEREKLSIDELVNQFEQAVYSSGAFSWIGITAGPDDYDGYATNVYLSEHTGPQVTDEMKELAADAVELFDDLAIKLEPYAVVDLHLMNDTNCAEIRKQLMEAVGGPALVWEKKLSLT